MMNAAVAPSVSSLRQSLLKNNKRLQTMKQ